MSLWPFLPMITCTLMSVEPIIILSTVIRWYSRLDVFDPINCLNGGDRDICLSSPCNLALSTSARVTGTWIYSLWCPLPCHGLAGLYASGFLLHIPSKTTCYTCTTAALAWTRLSGLVCVIMYLDKTACNKSILQSCNNNQQPTGRATKVRNRT